MKPASRKHLITCLVLGLLIVPVYFLDLTFTGPSGGNWITLNFRGLFLWTYVALLGIHVALTTVAIRRFPAVGLVRIHLGAVIPSILLLITAVFVVGSLRDWAQARQNRALMETRKSRIGVIELKEWWYHPNEISPTEIRVNVIVHEAGRFAGHIYGDVKDGSGSFVHAFESKNEPASQRWVGKNEVFTYVFPLQIFQPAAATDVAITLYLFKAQSGPTVGDLTKIFVPSPPQPDDGQSFYEVLPPPSRK